MLSSRNFKLLLAAVLLLALIGAVLLLARQGNGSARNASRRLSSGSNLALDLRYSYDAQFLQPGEYDGAAEFPLRLDGAEFSFYGKRIRGAGKILAREPGPVLYDFVGSQHTEVFEFWYKLEPEGEPKYEDAQLQGRLALHQSMKYKLGPDSRGWPRYFPDSLRGSLQPDGSRSGGADTAHIEGWVLFGSEDLYFFYAIGPRELSESERVAMVALINSMQFNALGADSTASAPEEGAAAQDEPAEEQPGAEDGKPGDGAPEGQAGQDPAAGAGR
ncbi:hypothetical protein IT575_07515 [bacterium]|nr:hypothetical protein [bacterium]